MLVARETVERDKPVTSSSFAIGETVQVVSLGKVGRITGRDGTKWLVKLTEGDAPVPCDASNLQPRQALMG